MARRLMKRQSVFLLLAVVIAARGIIAEAQQQPTKMPRIGYLIGASFIPVRSEALRQGLRDLGYVEGKSIIIEWRSAEGKLDRLPALAAELVRLNVDVIVTAGPTATRPARKASSTIPIVMTNEGDPVGTGFIASLARP